MVWKVRIYLEQWTSDIQKNGLTQWVNAKKRYKDIFCFPMGKLKIEERKSYDYEHLEEEKRIEILPVSLLACWAIAATQKFWLSSKS